MWNDVWTLNFIRCVPCPFVRRSRMRLYNMYIITCWNLTDRKNVYLANWMLLSKHYSTYYKMYNKAKKKISISIVDQLSVIYSFFFFITHQYFGPTLHGQKFKQNHLKRNSNATGCQNVMVTVKYFFIIKYDHILNSITF